MLSDLDPLMHARGLSALIVPLHESMHSSFRWIARGAKLTKGYAIKIVERDPVLVAYPMERDEAAASGLTARGVHDFGFDKIFRTAANPVAAYGEFFDVLRDLSGAPPPSAASVAFFGNVPAHIYVGVADELRGRGWRVASGGEDLIPAERIESISGASFRLRASTSTRGRRSRCSPRIAIWSRPATSSRSSRASTTPIARSASGSRTRSS